MTLENYLRSQRCTFMVGEGNNGVFITADKIIECYESGMQLADYHFLCTVEEWTVKILYTMGDAGEIRILKKYQSTYEKALSIMKKYNIEYDDVFSIDKDTCIEIIYNGLRNQEEKQKRRRITPGYIYLIESNGYYKIGRSKNFDSRKKKYITENPNRVNFICNYYTDDYEREEKRLHKKFAKKNHNREWFNLDQKDIEYIKSLCG